MEGLSGRVCCALLLAVLCMVPLAAGKAFKDTQHFALSVQQAKVNCPVTSCFLVLELRSVLPRTCSVKQSACCC